MDEELAEKKVCPVSAGFFRAGYGGQPQHVPAASGNVLCVGSDCMMWRVMKSPPAPKNSGYCGLAGAE
jgi:hypothetical protein